MASTTCVSAPCTPSRESLPLLHSSKHPLSGNFKVGEGQASQLNLAGWAFKFLFALCFWSCHLLYTPRFVFHRPRTSKSVKIISYWRRKPWPVTGCKKKILRLVLLGLEGGGVSPLKCKGWQGMVIRAYNPSTQETGQAEKPWLQGQTVPLKTCF